MYGSMVHIHSPTAEIRRGKKIERKKKIEITGQKYNGLPNSIGGHKEQIPLKLHVLFVFRLRWPFTVDPKAIK